MLFFRVGGANNSLDKYNEPPRVESSGGSFFAQSANAPSRFLYSCRIAFGGTQTCNINYDIVASAETVTSASLTSRAAVSISS